MFTTIRLLLGVIAFAPALPAATTVNPGNHFAYGANLGWIDWRGDTNNGAVIGEFICSGSVYAANVGWISLGGGVAANGIRYQNNTATDFGVNHDGFGNLSGLAYGPNIGWVAFTNRDAAGGTYSGPKVDLATGKLSGSAWSANCGWISLSNAQAFLQTDTIRPGVDTDRDGISDAWEYLKFGKLTAANGTTDTDGDGLSDLKEYLADTDPNDPDQYLRITSSFFGPAGSPVGLTWTSVASRQYRVLETTDVTSPLPWVDVGLGLISPDAGRATTRSFLDSPSSQRYFSIQVTKPLSP